MKEQEHWSTALFGLALLACFGSFVYSAVTWQWHWFARSGAFMVFAGVVMTGTQFVEARRKFDHWIQGQGLQIAGREQPVRPVVPMYPNTTTQWISEYSGFQLLLIGTLIWGFGDLPAVFWPQKPM